jgi:hypothetical protein
MKSKGQLTLETAILLLTALNMFIYITMPLGNVSQAASESVGSTALAVKNVDSIVQAANMVGLSGDGSKNLIELRTYKRIIYMPCNYKTISAEVSVFDVTDVDELPESFGVIELLHENVEEYEKEADFPLNCNFQGITAHATTPICVCFENNGGEIEITASDKPLDGCTCLR